MNHLRLLLVANGPAFSLSTRNGRLGLLVVILSMLLVGTSAADSWYEHYAKGEEALAQQNWTQAVEQFNQALERKGDSGARVRCYPRRRH